MKKDLISKYGEKYLTMAKIENEKQYKALNVRMDELVAEISNEKKVSANVALEMKILGALISEYEKEHYPVSASTFSEILQYKMTENNLTQSDVSQCIGVSRSRISEYLKGKAESTLKIAKKMCKEMNISPALMLGFPS